MSSHLEISRCLCLSSLCRRPAGKTLLAKAIASNIDANFLKVSLP